MENKSSYIRTTVAALMAALAGSAVAAVSAEEAKQLGGATLTIFGAEKAGNKDGTIPEYTGAQLKAPASWDPKEPGRRPDPFNEKPLLSITAQNAAQHADKLTEGMKELFKRYPSYRMDVYPSHRTLIYPKYVLDNTLKNATACKTDENEVRVEGCYGGFPFPIPKTGSQLMWNHLLAYENITWASNTRSWIVPISGSPVLTGGTNGVQNTPFFDPGRTTPAQRRDVYWRFHVESNAPTRQVGEKLIVIDHVDSTRRAYQYIPGQRRVKLAPDLAYDTPSPYTGGSSNMDDGKVFLGAPDRYDFKLVGKKEKYIPYNTFNLTDYKVCPEDKVTSTKSFPNPDCVRWELHRVWVVQASLKPNYRHIYKSRTFYFDEDSYLSGMADNYDAAAKLYRVIWAASYPFYEGGANAGGNTFQIDMHTGIWSVQGSTMAPGTGYFPVAQKPENFYSPESLAGEGIR